MYSESFEEDPNPDNERFYSLWMSLAVRMLSNKSEANHSQSSFDQWTSLMSEISPHPKTISKDFYHAKR